MDVANPSRISKMVDLFEGFTHIVLLAAKIGRVMFNTDPKPNAGYNTMIFNNVVETVDIASWLYDMKYDFTFYSTSEVYGSAHTSESVITESTAPSIITSDRGAYSS